MNKAKTNEIETDKVKPNLTRPNVTRPNSTRLSIIGGLLLLLLPAIIMSVSATQYTGCLANATTSSNPTMIIPVILTKGMFYAFQPGTSPITTCISGDYNLSFYDKTEIDFIISVMNSIQNNIANIENSLAFLSQVYVTGLPAGNSINVNFVANTTAQNFGQFTFFLPSDSYVDVESTGQLLTAPSINDNYVSVIFLSMMVDQNPVCGTNCIGNDGNWRLFLNNQPVQYANGFQTASVRHLTAGYHTVYLAGYAISTDNNQHVQIVNGVFNTIASQNNNPNLNPAIQPGARQTMISTTNTSTTNISNLITENQKQNK